MMKFGTLVCLLFALFLSQNEAQMYSRLKQLFPSFDDPENIPSDFQLQDDGLGYVDVDPAVDTDGRALPVDGLGYRIFDKEIRFLTCYDTGHCVCDPANAITRTVTLDTNPPGDATTGTDFEPDLCLIAPNWVEGASSGMEYRMAHRHVDSANSFQQHDVALISAVVTRAFNWWPQSWSAVYAEIITWIITESATGAMDKFQVVLTLGDDGKTYVLYLYETVGSFPATTPVRGFLNGQYGAAEDVTSARICPSTAGSDAMPSNDDLMKKSNLKCGRPGFYLFTTEDGDACLGTTPCATYEHDNNLNCNRSSIPKDSCTESFSCTIDADNNINLDITLQWYKWKSLRALDYETFKGTGTEEEPECVQVWAGSDEKCWKKDLPHPGENDPSVAIYTLVMAEDTPECGTVVEKGSSRYTCFSSLGDTGTSTVTVRMGRKDPVAKSVKFVYKNYNYDPDIHANDRYEDVDQDGDVIIYGTCHYSDLPVVVSQSVMLNDFSAPTRMTPRDRTIEMHVVDRDTASGLVLTSVKVGRDYYLRICFQPGTPFTPHADPFGCHATECIAGNNENFDNVASSWERSLTFISNGCPITTPTEPLKLTRSFQADLAYSSYEGDGWCILTGKIDAANWFTLNAGVPVTKLFFKCSVEFCTKQDGIGFGQGFEQQKCIDNCEDDNTRRRRRSTGQGVETVYTSVELIYPNDTATDTKTEPHVDSESPTIVIVILVIAVVMVIVAIGICILVYWKLRAMKTKQQAMKSSKERLYEVDQWSNLPIKY